MWSMRLVITGTLLVALLTDARRGVRKHHLHHDHQKHKHTHHKHKQHVHHHHSQQDKEEFDVPPEHEEIAVNRFYPAAKEKVFLHVAAKPAAVTAVAPKASAKRPPHSSPKLLIQEAATKALLHISAKPATVRGAALEAAPPVTGEDGTVYHSKKPLSHLALGLVQARSATTVAKSGAKAARTVAKAAAKASAKAAAKVGAKAGTRHQNAATASAKAAAKVGTTHQNAATATLEDFSQETWADMTQDAARASREEGEASPAGSAPATAALAAVSSITEKTESDQDAEDAEIEKKASEGEEVLTETDETPEKASDVAPGPSPAEVSLPSPAEASHFTHFISSSGMVDALLDDYNSDDPPMKTADGNVQVAVAFAANKLLELNQVERTITFAGWVRQFWYDPRLEYSGNNIGSAWNHTGDFLMMSVDDIWHPDVQLINSVDFNWGESCDSVPAYVYDSHGHEGPKEVAIADQFHGISQMENDTISKMKYNVMWSRPCVLKAKCDINLRMYPFDSNICPLSFEPWGDKFLEMHVASEAMVTKVSLPEFSVKLYNATSEKVFYEAAAAAWPVVTFRLLIARHGHYYVVNYICPILLMVLLTWFAYWVPLSASDRIAYMMTMVLTVMATQSINAEKRPATDRDMWMDDFQTSTLLLVIGSALYTIWIMRWQPGEDWSDEATNARKQLLQWVERIARIVFPLVAAACLGSLFWELYTYESTGLGHGKEKNFSGRATIAVMTFCAVVVILKLWAILCTWFPHYTPHSAKRTVDKMHNHAVKSEADLSKHRFSSGAGPSEGLPRVGGVREL